MLTVIFIKLSKDFRCHVSPLGADNGLLACVLSAAVLTAAGHDAFALRVGLILFCFFCFYFRDVCVSAVNTRNAEFANRAMQVSVRRGPFSGSTEFRCIVLQLYFTQGAKLASIAGFCISFWAGFPTYVEKHIASVFTFSVPFPFLSSIVSCMGMGGQT
jgi:hypothetical protein